MVHEGCDLCCGFSLHTWKSVGVLAECEGGISMAETFADHLDGDACFEGESGVGMPQVMEPDAEDSGPYHCPDEHLGEEIRVERVAVLWAEDQSLIL